MKNIFIVALIFSALFTIELFAKEEHYSASVVPKHMSVKEKKKRFFALMVPPVVDAYKKLYNEYKSVESDLKQQKNLEKINFLKKKYKVKTDKELLVALKPHPVSITLAQAAIESAWGTSRFFIEANNIFGVHGLSSKGSIPAGVKKNGRTVWVRKYKTLEDAILDYYRMLSTVPTYKKFKRLNYEDQSVYKIVEGLKYYSERGEDYVNSIKSVIKHNNLTKYDTKVAQ